MKIYLMALFISFCSPLQKAFESENSSTYVWICTGNSAYSYHCNKGCRGLNQCEASIKKVTLEYAHSIQRRACKICYKKREE